MPPRNSPGEIRDAIVNVLRTRTGVWSVREIRAGVMDQLGREVPPSSVRSYLRLNADTFERAGRGEYQLVADSQLELLNGDEDERSLDGQRLNGTREHARS